MTVRIPQGVGQEEHEGELTESLALGRTGNMVADCFRDTLPSGVVFFFRGEPQNATKVLHAQMGTAILIDIEAVRNEGFAIPGNLGPGSGENFGCDLQAEVFVECCKGQIAGGAFDDVLASEKGGFVEGFDATGRFAPIEKFGDHSRNPACGVLIDMLRKGFFWLVPFSSRRAALSWHFVIRMGFTRGVVWVVALRFPCFIFGSGEDADPPIGTGRAAARILRRDDPVVCVFDLVPKEVGFVPKDADFVPKGVGFVLQEAGFVLKEVGFVPKDAGFVPKEVGFVLKEAGFVPKEDDLAPKEVGLAPKEVGLVPKEAGFVPKEVGFVPKEVGFVLKEVGFVLKEDGFVPMEAF